jgi:eukaryotic-like serine/threonine-protein kinase
MALASGTRLGPYEIGAQIGAGGMGEVYRAKDMNLGRDVAIKVLPEALAHDPERLARFEREARTLALLNHPNIAIVHGLETSTSATGQMTRALVMELVDGLTLADRLVSSPLSVPEALRVALQIAEGLEAAHEKGIVHRDLKPSNIKMTMGGAVKILDFGLAKAWGDSKGPSDLTHSPTVVAPATHAGVILGTAAYMSPEQAEGRPVDRRADVWAFGTVFFEMLTGTRAFDGKSVSHVIVHVLEQEPDWTRLPQATPAIVRDVLERCLQKDPSQRPRDIGDLRLQLRAIATQSDTARAQVRTRVGSATSLPPTRTRWLWPTVATVAVGLATIAALLVFYRQERAAPESVRFEITEPTGVNFSSSLSLSPDGRQLAFIATSAEGNYQIWLRRLNAIEARPLPGTERVDGVPFWSPDGRRLAFSTNGSLRTIEVLGGPAQTVTQISGAVLSGFWAADNTLVFGTNSGTGIWRVAVSGGNPMPLTKSTGATTDGFPVLLPDGRHFLFSRLSFSATPGTGIYVGSLDGQTGSQPRMLLPDNSPVVYSTSSDPSIGYILFVRSTSPGVQSPGEGSAVLMAQRFNTQALQLVGDPAVIASGVAGAGFSVSNDALVYGTGPRVLENSAGAVDGQLTWLDRQGKVLGTIDDRAIYMSVALSPDDSEAAFMRADQSGNMDIWVADLTRSVTRRLTFDPAPDWFPIWSPDGQRIAFASSRGGQLTLHERAANGEGEERPLAGAGPQSFPLSWSRDGRLLLYAQGSAAQTDVWALPMDGGTASKPLPVMTSMFRELAFFAPDGQWITYVSSESGRPEIYVRPFDSQSPGSGGKTRISTDGGINTRWSADGSEIFYMTASGEMMAVDVTTKPTLKTGKPKLLFKGPPVLYWTVTRDGQRFLMAVPFGTNSTTSTPYRVVLNWTSTLSF